ncbi:MAG: hypothetical protein KDC07_08215, partial [Chitinophagaceae bacterium]|nr:hypothetical protein [Chitinophagaceae bacterium]
MRKSLLLVVFLIASLVSSVNAQEELFKAPDSVCEKQLIQLLSNVPDKQSHYWGFCSGYLYKDPTGVNLGDTFKLDLPAGIEVAKDDDGNYYGFAINAGNNSFLRMDFGTDLSSIPTITDFGNMDGIFPDEVNSLYLVRDLADKRWYIFLTSGQTAATSALSRIDFGKSLSNTPNIVNFGNLENKLNYPTGVFVAKEGDKWYGFYCNFNGSQLMRFDLDSNISLTPTIKEILPVTPALLSGPTDIGAIIDGGKWYFFITNANANSVSRVDMDKLTNETPNITVVSNSIPDLKSPSAITLLKDCGKIHGIITNAGSHDVVRLEMGDVNGPYNGTNFGNIGSTLSPVGISRVIRDRDNVYAFIVNQANNSLTRIKFEQCDNASIQYSLTNKPPKYSYDTAGFYNVYYAVNEGLPDMQVQCKQITVLPTPALILLPPDTTICQGDTARLRMVSINAISYSWTPNYNISGASKNEIKVWPEYTTQYNVRMPFPLGTCVVDTHITVNVIKLQADAGPDRTIKDGASTLLGGPNTSQGLNHLRRWVPDQYIDDIYSDNPMVRPPHDFTYYLVVTDTGSKYKCASIDTVVVYVECGDVNLPNAFMPESNGARAKFGLLN